MLRLYAPSFVLALWALLWALGVTGNLVIVVGLLSTALAVVAHASEYRNGGHARP